MSKTARAILAILLLLTAVLAILPARVGADDRERDEGDRVERRIDHESDDGEDRVPTRTPTPPRSVRRSVTPTPTATRTPTRTPLASATATPTRGVPPSKRFGVNLAGGEFGEQNLPGTMGKDYVYPNSSTEYGYFSSKGLTLIRLPFRWERVQNQGFGPLSEQDVAGIRSALDAALASHQVVLIEPHNYGRYYNRPLTPSDAALFSDFWRKAAAAFSSHPALYGYELMNEPHDLPGGSDTWQALAQAGTDAIRQVDHTHPILVPGYSWQSARFWRDNNESLHVNDAYGLVAYSAHIYFDANYTGTYANSYASEGAYPDTGVDRIQPFLDWLAAHDERGMLTEYGVPDTDPRWNVVLDHFLSTLNSSPRILGGTYWAAGPWWGTYPLSVEPRNGQDRPQMVVLSHYPTR